MVCGQVEAFSQRGGLVMAQENCTAAQQGGEPFSECAVWSGVADRVEFVLNVVCVEIPTFLRIPVCRCCRVAIL